MSATGSADTAVERARLAALVDNLDQGVLMETPLRRVARTNRAFCLMFGIPAPPEALVGGDCVEAARSLQPLLGDIDGFLSRVEELISQWVMVNGERITLTDGRLLERDFLPVTHSDGTREIAWVYRDVTQWENLRAAAERSAQQSAELLSAISHDVRTPVTGIVGLVELLQRQPIDGRTRQIVDSVKQSAASLTTMLDDFLDAARADAGLLEVVAEPVRLETLLESVTDMVGPLARSKGLLLVTGIDPELPEWVDVDAGRVRQILLNLVSNAVKFTNAGTVALSASAADHDIVMECQDTGPGLGDQPPDEVFRSFVRGSDRRASSTGGAGLGLAIASKLARVMGGSLRVSETNSSGSVFQLRLPLTITRPTEAHPGPLIGRRVQVVGPALAARVIGTALRRAGADVVTNGADVTVVITEELPIAREPGTRTIVLAPLEPFRVPLEAAEVLSTPVTQSALCTAVLGVEPGEREVADLPSLPPGLQVLVVEDDSTNRALIVRMLEVLGVAATSAADGVAALQAVAADQYDAVLMDVNLPGLDGVEATGLIRQRRNEAADTRLPIIAMSGSSEWAEPHLMAASGFDAALPKPMTLDELHSCLAGVISVTAPEGAHRPSARVSGSVDTGVLAELAGDIGDEELVRDTVRTYLDELPLRLDAMARAVRAGDQRSIKETAHSLKSASAMLGALRMGTFCAALEAEAARDAATTELLQPVLTESAQVAADMAAYLD